MDSTADSTRLFSERIFFNLLVILKGVVLGYGAMILVELIDNSAPWKSTDQLALYLAWLATLLLATLTFLSQAVGSLQSPIHPTTVAILLTFALAVAEMVLFGAIQPSNSVPPTEQVHRWIFVMGVTNAIAAAFITMVLGQLASPKFPGVRDTPQLRAQVRRDRAGALGSSAFVLVLGALLFVPAVKTTAAWVVVAVVGAALVPPLVMQQHKLTHAGEPQS